MFEIKESQIHARGVFATRFIKEGTSIMEIIGERIDGEETIKREIENLKKGSTYIFIVNDEYSIDGEHHGNESRYINHSCDPNSEVMGDDDKIFIVALRDILPNEEITIDYAFPQDEDIITQCYCKSAKCRGVIEEVI
jgi:uncharacterized protein